jgi:serine protease Do
VCKFSTGSGSSAGSSQSYEFAAAGSGIIYKINKISGQAYIITNYHVVYDADANGDGISRNISVYFYGKEYSDYSVSGEFVGGSINSDIAVVRVVSNYLKDDFYTAVSVGNSNAVMAGDRVLAVGNANAEGIGVTAGIVSMDSQIITMPSLLNSSQTVNHRVMRMDASINGGNSGGGLFNKNAEFIGIVNAKTVDVDVENMSYAIPSNVAVGIAESVIGGIMKKARLGISSSPYSASAVYDPLTGKTRIVEEVEVHEVTASGAANGKLRAEDILLSVSIGGGAEFAIERSFYLSDFLYKVRSGDTLTFKVLRGGIVQTVDVTIADKDMTAF